MSLFRLRYLLFVGLCFGLGLAACSDDGDGDSQSKVVDTDAGTTDTSSNPDTSLNPDTSTNTCSAGKTPCGQFCVDVNDDPRHCGGCGLACNDGEVCASGQCEVVEDCNTDGCSGMSYCEESSGQCLGGCASNDQCGEHEVCDADQHECTCADGYETCSNGAGCCPEIPGTFSSSHGQYKDVAMAIDSSGRTHLALVDLGSGLYYGVENSSGGFDISQVKRYSNTLSVKGWVSIAVDSSGTPHIAFSGTDGGVSGYNVWYATRESSDWRVEQVALTFEQLDTSPAIAIDGSDEPHVVYREWNTASDWKNLYYASRGPDSWSRERIDSGAAFSTPSLAFNDFGEPEVAYNSSDGAFNTEDGDLKFALRSAGDWYAEVVNGAGDNGYGPSNGVDGSNTTSMSYYDKTNGNVLYTYFGASDWETETVGSATSCIKTSLAFDASGSPHVAYVDRPAQTLHYAHSSGGSWTTLALSGARHGASDIAIAPDGTVRIAYIDMNSVTVWSLP